MARLEGTQLGAYDIIERVGSGGMAEVYRAKQRTAFDREVAIKVIRKGYAEDEDFRARFLREARAISLLSHLNILPLIEFGENKDGEELLYLVMPYVAGGTLRDRIKKQGGPLPLRDTVRIFSQLCEAVEHAHQHGLVHRDIKPSNVLLQDGRNVLLADFGIALDTGDARLTGTGMGLGTAEYMAPEQAKGQADKRSDVYSLGVVLYVMLTGQAPYSGNTPFDVLLKHSTEPIPPILDTNPEVPEPIVKVVETAMAKKPEDRFQSAHAMLNAFEQAIIQIGPQAITSLQWSGSLPAIRLSDLQKPPSRSNPPSPGGISGPSTPISGPSGAGRRSDPSGASSAPPISGPSSGGDLSSMPTFRPANAGSQFPLPSASGFVGDPEQEQPTISTGDPATISTPTGVTVRAPQPPMPSPALYQSGPVPAINVAHLSGAQPVAPTPVLPSGPVAPLPPVGKPRNTLLIAFLAALIVVVIGVAVLTVLLVLKNNQTATNPGTTGTQVPSATAAPAFNPVFTTGSPCAQPAANPAGPAAKPGSYNAPSLVYRATGSPAFLDVSRSPQYNGSVYYSDQTAQAIFLLSPAIKNKPASSIGSAPQPSGVVISRDAADDYALYYLQTGQPGQQGINRNTQGIVASFQDAGIVTVPGFNPLVGFALGQNPTNDAILVPSPTSGTLACLSKGSHSLGTPFITGLKQPVAAAVDSQGNVYVADDGVNMILRFNGQTGHMDWEKPFTAPQDVIVDANGYLVASVLGSGPGQGSVVRINPTTGAVVTTLASNLQEPRGLALNTSSYDTNGIYFIDQGATTINELVYNPPS
jgi:serine/threonine protein kinase/streptogramin lyase